MRLRLVYRTFLSFILDLTAALTALGLAAAWRYSGEAIPALRRAMPAPELALATWIAFWILSLWVAGLYDRNRVLRFRDETTRLVWAAVLHGLLMLALIAVAKAHGISRLFVGTAFIFQGFLTWAARAQVRRLLSARARQRHSAVRALLVASAERAAEITSTLTAHPELGVEVVGRVDPAQGALVARRHLNGAVKANSPDRVPLLGDPSTLPEILRKTVVDEIFLAVPEGDFGLLQGVRRAAWEQGKTIHVLVPGRQADLVHPRLTRIGDQVLLSYVFGPQDSPMLLVKRLIDVVAATALLVLASPFLALIAMAIKLTSPGPVLFRQKRVGLHGRVFTLYKFRTMVDGAERMREELLAANDMSGPVFKLRDDPRVTPLGRMLRRWSLDELPQLWNVLLGDMSLVGPRPLPVAEVEALPHKAQRRHAVRPGLSGWWQVSGRSRLRSTELLVAKDLEYIDGWTLGKDLSILLRTVPEVLWGGGW